MDMRDRDKYEQEKGNDNPMNYHSPGSMSSDWRFNSANITNASMVVPADGQMAVCRGDLVGASSCSPSVIDSFGPALWDQSTNSQNLGFCDINVQNNVSTSNTIGIRSDIHSSLGSSIDKTLEMGWNAPSSLLKGGIFLPNVPGMLSQSLSQFPTDTAFIDRAARFSCFNAGNFSDVVNPFSMPESMGLCSRGGEMLQGAGEIFNGSGLRSVSGGQAQKNAMSVGDTSKDADHLVTGGSPLKNERKSESLAPSHDETKQGVARSGHDSDEAEFSGGGVGCQDEPMMEGHGGESSAKSLILKKRKRGGQDTELDQATVDNQSAEDTKDNTYNQQKGDQKPSPGPSKATGKQGKQVPQTSDPLKEEYIHVRARRGQATNSHSLAERVRREKISERMKFLQDLVPGCNKVTGKAVMLDEIINYVQSLQRQVEFLSMKLATVNPRLDLNIEGLLAKDIFQSRAVPSGLPYSAEMSMAYPPLHSSQPGLIQAAFPGMDNHSDVLRRTINSHLTPMTGVFKEAAQLPNVWDDELHNFIQMSYATSPPQDNQDVNGIPCDASYPFFFYCNSEAVCPEAECEIAISVAAGSLPPGHLKVEL